MLPVKWFFIDSRSFQCFPLSGNGCELFSLHIRSFGHENEHEQAYQVLDYKETTKKAKENNGTVGHKEG